MEHTGHGPDAALMRSRRWRLRFCAADLFMFVVGQIGAALLACTTISRIGRTPFRRTKFMSWARTPRAPHFTARARRIFYAAQRRRSFLHGVHQAMACWFIPVWWNIQI